MPNMFDETVYRQLSRLSIYFLLPKILGLCDYPCNVYGGKVSKWYKLYAYGLCVFSFHSFVQSVIFCLFPSIMPRFYLPTGPQEAVRIYSYALPVWNLAAFGARCSLVHVGMKSKQTHIMRKMCEDIKGNMHLKKHVMDSRHFWLSIGEATFCLALFLVGFVISLTTRQTVNSDLWSLWLLPVVVLNVAAVAYGVLTCGAFSINYILPMLKITAKMFDEAVKTTNVALLDEAIACHDICCRLIERSDDFMCLFLGTQITTAIPLFVIILANLNTLLHYAFNFKSALLFVILFYLSIFRLAYVAAVVNCAAHLPDHIVSRTVYHQEDFAQKVIDFRARFNNNLIGFTYWKLSTLNKETMLIMLNQTMAYLVIVFQMKISSTSKSSEQPHSSAGVAGGGEQLLTSDSSAQ